MADQEDFADGNASAPKPGKKKLFTLLAGVGILFGEGAAVFFAAKMLYKQPAVVQAELSSEEQALEDAKQETEIALPELNAFNKREGRLYMYNLEITIRVRQSKAEEVCEIIEARKSTILDRFNTVIRGAETKYLNEPGLETLRRQLSFELNKILGDDELVLELLIPKFYQSPANV